jgi:O-antigen/teichoic acid export membrane protein
MSLSKRLTYNFILSVSQVLFPLITIPYISRVLDPGGVGQVGFIDSYTYFFMAVAEFGIITYGVREIARVQHAPEQLRQLVSELLSIQLIVSLCTMLFYVAGIWLLWEKIGDKRMVVFSALFFFANFFYSEWYFWGRQRFKYIAIRSILIRIAGVVLIFLLVRKQTDAWVYYAIISGTSIFVLISNMMVLFSEIKIRFHNLQLKKHVSPLLRMNGINLAYSIFLMLDTPMLRLLSNEAEAGYYYFSIKFIRLSTMLVTDLFLVLFPQTVQVLENESKEKVVANYQTSSELIFILSLPLAVGIFMLSGDFTAFYFGSSFSPVADNLQILALFPVLCSFELYINRQVLLSHNQDRVVLWIVSAGALVFCLSSFFLSSAMGANGASIALLLGEFLMLCLSYYFAKRNFKSYVQVSYRTIGEILLGCLLICIVVIAIRQIHLLPVIKISFSIVMGVLVYFIWMIVIAKNKIAQKMMQFVIDQVKSK